MLPSLRLLHDSQSDNDFPKENSTNPEFVSDTTHNKQINSTNKVLGDNIIGRSFGSLKVQKKGRDAKGNMSLQCLCECGNETFCSRAHLVKGLRVSCGCVNSRRKKEVAEAWVKSMTGKSVGRLTIRGVTSPPEGRNEKSKTYIKCDCECGESKVVCITDLTSMKVKSCGCLRKSTHNFRNGGMDLKDRRYGRLVVESKFDLDKGASRARWLCKCDCGGISHPLGQDLQSGGTRSCGCIKDARKLKAPANTVFAFNRRLAPWKCDEPTDLKTRFKALPELDLVKRLQDFSDSGRAISEEQEPQEAPVRKVGKLVVLRRVRASSKVLCQCECGNLCQPEASDLANGNVTSCGCDIVAPVHVPGGRLLSTSAPEPDGER